MTSTSTVTHTTAFSRLSLHVAALAACATFSFPALAQSPASVPADASANTSSAATPHVNRTAHRQQWQEKRAARRVEHMVQLKQKLVLNPAQEAAWTDFTTALQERNNFARLDRGHLQDLTTPERIDRMRAIRAQRTAAMDQRTDAIKVFYGQLQPDQQTTFDQSSARMMRNGGMGHMAHMSNHKGHTENVEQGGHKGQQDHTARKHHHESMGPDHQEPVPVPVPVPVQ